MGHATLPEAFYWWWGVELGPGLPTGTLYSGRYGCTTPSAWLVCPRGFPVQSLRVFPAAPASSGHRTPRSRSCVCWLPKLPSERSNGEKPVEACGTSRCAKSRYGNNRSQSLPSSATVFLSMAFRVPLNRSTKPPSADARVWSGWA